MHRRTMLLLASIFSTGPSTLSAAQAPPPEVQQANRLFEARDWRAAARAYEALVERSPGDPAYRLRLGISLLGLGEAEQALRALAPAGEAPGALGGMVHFAAARAQARLGRKEEAFAELKKAVAAGFAGVSLLEGEADLASLREDPRFTEVRRQADRNAHPCAYRAESRQLDFWVGDWEVSASGRRAGTSHVERILDGCVIFENWTGENGYSGKSFNLYDAAKKRWQQTWVDNQGGLLEFYGELRDGNLYFTGESAQPGQAGPVLQKLTFFDQGPEQVRQLWEQSSDGGKTWSVVFDGTYTRKERRKD